MLGGAKVADELVKGFAGALRADRKTLSGRLELLTLMLLTASCSIQLSEGSMLPAFGEWACCAATM